MLAYSNHIAAEHLQVHTADPQATAAKLRNYGSLFIGALASVVSFDKCCGTNHTLPTFGAGRYTGGLWVGSYLKVCTHQWLDARGVAAVAPAAVRQSAQRSGRPPACRCVPYRPQLRRLGLGAAGCGPLSVRIGERNQVRSFSAPDLAWTQAAPLLRRSMPLAMIASFTQDPV
jgi:hypothetical protein